MNIKICVMYMDQLFLAFNMISGKPCYPRYGLYSSLQATRAALCDDSGEYELCSRLTRFDAHSYCVYTKGKYRFKYEYSMFYNTLDVQKIIMFRFSNIFYDQVCC